MSEKETFEKLQTIVSNQLGIEKEKVVPSADFTKELGADSLDVVELVMAFEEEFEIEIDDEVAGEMSTVQDALNYILANKSDSTKVNELLFEYKMTKLHSRFNMRYMDNVMIGSIYNIHPSELLFFSDWYLDY